MRALRSMSWRDFEVFTGELFRDEGYRVAERKKEGRGGGTDLTLSKAGRKYIVQCKHYIGAALSLRSLLNVGPI